MEKLSSRDQAAWAYVAAKKRLSVLIDASQAFSDADAHMAIDQARVLVNEAKEKLKKKDMQMGL